MLEVILNWVFYFILYSVVGYICEVTLSSLREKKLVNRGFLFGPWIPIYGVGTLLILIFTFSVKKNLTLTFLVSMLVCSFLEYFTSWAMEKIFNIKWWDYSKTDKYNLNGRICLRNCLAFGIGGSLIVFQFHPLVESFVSGIFLPLKTSIIFIFLILFILDLIASNYAVIKVKKTLDFGKIVGDQTNEVKRAARKIIKELFKKKRRFERKLEKRRKKIQRKLEKEKRKLERKLKKK